MDSEDIKGLVFKNAHIWGWREEQTDRCRKCLCLSCVCNSSGSA